MSMEARAVCATCRRPTGVCYCAHVTRIPTKTRVVILQHPRERDVAINTARIAALCLPNAELHVGVSFEEDAAMAARLEGAMVLYPGPGAVDITEARGVSTLVLLDGTWWQAKKLLRSNPRVAALPRVAFQPDAPSDYRIRREPEAHFVSTIEALVHALGVLEGDPGRATAMLAPFRAMVDMQIAHRERQNVQRAYTRKPVGPRSPRERLPRQLFEAAGDLVCVHAESNAWPYDSAERATWGEELVQWVAYRVATGETFEAFVLPAGPVSASTALHLELDDAIVRSGTSTEAFARAWRAFARPTDRYVSWGPHAPRLFQRATGEALAALDLRHAARLFVNGRAGTMGSFLQRLERAPAKPSVSGRAQSRLGHLVTIATTLAGR